MREQITNHSAVIKALAQTDFAERAGEADDETPIQSIKRHYTNALLADQADVLNAITAYGEAKAANIYALFYSDL